MEAHLENSSNTEKIYKSEDLGTSGIWDLGYSPPFLSLWGHGGADIPLPLQLAWAVTVRGAGAPREPEAVRAFLPCDVA